MTRAPKRQQSLPTLLRFSGYNLPAGGRECDAEPQVKTKVGSIKHGLISNLECYNAAGEFKEIVDGKTL
jgi:hypothetical protein